MKKCLSVIISIAALSILMGCASKPQYKSEMTVGPASGGVKEHHLVKIKVFKMDDGQEPVLVTSPHAIVIEGEKGVVNVSSGTGNSFNADILVQRNDENVQATATIIITQESKIVWTDTQTVVENE